MRHLIFIALLFGATTSYAQGGRADRARIKGYHNSASTNTHNLLEGVALNAAAAADRTITLATHGWSKLVIGVFFTRSAATTVTATPSCARRRGAHNRNGNEKRNVRMGRHAARKLH